MHNNTFPGAIMARKVKYYLSGNGQDRWEISILKGKHTQTVKEFDISARLAGLDRQSDTYKRKRNLYYLQAKVEAEAFLAELEKQET